MAERKKKSTLAKNQSSLSHPIATPPCGRPVPKKQRPQGSPDGWKQKLEAYLSAKDLNHTEPRVKLIELLFRKTGHFTIQELIHWIADKHPQLGSATVYRNIPVLIESGILKETLTDESGQHYYEMATDEHHDHIVCVTCNSIFEFHDERIEKAQDQVIENLGFSPIKHRHVVFATCEYGKKGNL